MQTETLYELLQDYKDPNGSVAKGVRKTEHQWMARFALLNPNDCAIKNEWFKPVQVPIYNEEDMVDFAEYIMNHEFPKSDEPSDLYFKWKAVR